MARERGQGGPAACAGGAQRVRGGGAEIKWERGRGVGIGRGEAHRGLVLREGRPEKGRRRRGEAPTANGDGERRSELGARPIRPGNNSNGLGEVRSGWTASLRGSGRDESRRGGEQWPARRTAATLLDLAPLELEDGDGREGRDGAGRFEVVREVKSGAQTRWPTRGSSPPATVAGMASGRHSAKHSGVTVPRLNEFDLILTI